MLTIPAARLKIAWAVLKRYFDIRGSQSALPLQIQTSSSGIRLRAVQHQLAAEHHLPGRFPDATFVIPLDTLVTCIENRQGDVTFRSQTGGRIQVAWENRGIPRSREVQATEWMADFPQPPRTWTEQPNGFRPALREAMTTTAKESNRYALNCVQLRGAAGQLIGTDSVQLLVQGGFEFPFQDDLLIPANKVFQQGQELDASATLELGVCPKHLAIRCGDWTFWLPLQQDLRFPKVDSLIPAADRVTCQVDLSPQDREFLLGALDGLPGGNDKHTPVTLDLNGAVRVRARDTNQPQPTEVVLADSRSTGDALAISTSREYLQRALRLGFDRLLFQGQEHPVCCSEGHRHYVWMALGKDSIIPASESVTRIHSPAVPNGVQAPPAPRPTPVAVSLSPSPRTAPAAPTAAPLTRTESEAGSEPQSLGELLEQADRLRDILKGALEEIRTLTSGLRKQRQKFRQMQQTLRSIRQLQTSDV